MRAIIWRSPPTRAVSPDSLPRSGQHRLDILLHSNGEVGVVIVIVIDTTWKSLSTDPLARRKGISQADIYQMIAYARLYHCNRLMLLYPVSSGSGSDVIRQLGIDGGREVLGLGRIDRPMWRRRVVVLFAW